MSNGEQAAGDGHAITLRVDDGGDGNAHDHADWGDARLTCAAG